MNNTKPEFYFLLVALIGTSVLVFFVFQPFLYALVLAVVFAVVFSPVHEKIIRYLRVSGGLSAILTMLVVVAFIFAPLMFIGVQVVGEARDMYSFLTEKVGTGGFSGALNNLFADLQVMFPAIEGFSINAEQYAKQGLSWVIQNLGSFFADIAKIMMSLFVFLFALYYLLKDGEKIKKFIIVLSPLHDSNDEAIFKKLEVAANSIVKGNLLIAVSQGALAGIGLWIFGVPNAALLGSLTVITAFIPGIGTAIVLAPAVGFLFLTEETVSGFGLLVWGIVAVGMIDNFLGPKLIGRGMQIHPLIVLLSVLGGIAFFGPVGLLIGPLTVSFLFALLEIHFSMAGKK